MNRYFVSEIYGRGFVWRLPDGDWIAVEVAQCLNPLEAVNLAKALAANEATTT